MIMNEDTTPYLKHEFSLLVQRASTGDVEAQRLLGDFYLFHSEPQDIAAAVFWYVMAAERDDVESVYSLAGIYIDKQSAYCNPVKVLDYLKKGAALDDVRAMKMLGELYKTGYQSKYGDIQEDSDAAFVYFRMAAKFGDHDSQLEVAEAYRKGLGITQSAELADYWENEAKQTFIRQSILKFWSDSDSEKGENPH